MILPFGDESIEYGCVDRRDAVCDYACGDHWGCPADVALALSTHAVARDASFIARYHRGTEEDSTYWTLFPTVQDRGYGTTASGSPDLFQTGTTFVAGAEGTMTLIGLGPEGREEARFTFEVEAVASVGLEIGAGAYGTQLEEVEVAATVHEGRVMTLRATPRGFGDDGLAGALDVAWEVGDSDILRIEGTTNEVLVTGMAPGTTSLAFSVGGVSRSVAVEVVGAR